MRSRNCPSPPVSSGVGPVRAGDPVKDGMTRSDQAFIAEDERSRNTIPCQTLVYLSPGPEYPDAAHLCNYRLRCCLPQLFALTRMAWHQAGGVGGLA